MALPQTALFWQAHRDTNDMLQLAGWLAGLMLDADGQLNPNPLTRDEVARAATAGKPYSWAFATILTKFHM